MEEDIGHTLVHYLYTGAYETLNSPLDTTSLKSTTEYREYKRSVSVYYVAKLHNIHGLIDHAIANMEFFDKNLSIFEILEVTSMIYDKLPESETWLATYLEAKLKQAFVADSGIFVDKQFLNFIGKASSLDRALIKIIAQTYDRKLNGKVDHLVCKKFKQDSTSESSIC